MQPSWQNLKEYDDFYRDHKADVDRMNDIISIRISQGERIVSRMESNQWLTDEEKRFMEEDDRLQEEQDALGDKLNEAVANR